MVELVVPALIAAVFGVLTGWIGAYLRVRTENFATWQEISFSFDPNPVVLGVAIVFAVGMGVLGGFLPAFRAARISPVEAMRV